MPREHVILPRPPGVVEPIVPIKGDPAPHGWMRQRRSLWTRT